MKNSWNAFVEHVNDSYNSAMWLLYLFSIEHQEQVAHMRTKVASLTNFENNLAEALESKNEELELLKLMLVLNLNLFSFFI